MTLTDDQLHTLTLVITLVFGIAAGVPLGILIAKDWKR